MKTIFFALLLLFVAPVSAQQFEITTRAWEVSRNGDTVTTDSQGLLDFILDIHTPDSSDTVAGKRFVAGIFSLPPQMQAQILKGIELQIQKDALVPAQLKQKAINDVNRIINILHKERRLVIFITRGAYHVPKIRQWVIASLQSVLIFRREEIAEEVAVAQQRLADHDAFVTWLGTIN